MRDGSSNHGTRVADLSRRRLLALTGAGLSTGLAGCSGDGGGGGGETSESNESGGGDGTDSTDNESQGEPRSTQINLEPVVGVGDDVNFNVQGAGTSVTVNSYLYQRFGQPMIDGDMSTPLLEEYTTSDDNTSVTATVNDKGNWTNGDAITADDLYFTMEFDRLQDPEGSAIESVEKVDDTTVKWTTKQPQKEYMLVHDYRFGVDQSARLHPETYREWFEGLQDATTQEERNSVMQDLSETTFAHDEVPFSGPFTIEEYRTDEALLSLRDDYYWADDIRPCESAYFKFVGGEDARQQLIINGQVDVGLYDPFNKSLQSSAPDGVENVDTWANGRGYQFVFNHNNEHLADRTFRQALGHLVDIEQITTNVTSAGNYGQTTPGRQCGLLSSQTDEWLGDVGQQLYDYGTSGRPDEATSMLEEAGYTKEGGSWYGPNGNQVQLKFRAPTWDEYANTARTFNSQLNEFGIETNLLVTDAGTYYPKVNEEHDFDVTITFFGGSTSLTHPVTNFETDGMWTLGLGGAPTKALQLSKERDTVPGIGKPYELEIPSTPGELSVEGGGERVNLAELVSELNAPNPRERDEEIVQTIARYYNYDLSQMLVFDEVAGIWGNYSDWQWPEESEHADQVQTVRSGAYMVRNGYFDAKYE